MQCLQPGCTRQHAQQTANACAGNRPQHGMSADEASAEGRTRAWKVSPRYLLPSFRSCFFRWVRKKTVATQKDTKATWTTIAIFELHRFAQMLRPRCSEAALGGDDASRGDTECPVFEASMAKVLTDRLKHQATMQPFCRPISESGTWGEACI